MGYKATKCIACGADIMLMKTRNGKTLPVDAESIYFREDKNGCNFVRPDLEVVKGSTCKENDHGAQIGFISHYATCGNHDELKKGKFRKKDRKGKHA